MTEQSDRSAMINHKTLPPSGPLSYLHGSILKTWTSYWKREGSAGMDTWNAPTVQSRQPLTYMLMESVGLRGPRWLGSSWQRGISESGSSQLSTLMIQTPGDLVWDLPCVQQASCLEGGPLLWIWPLYLHVNQKSDDDDDDDGKWQPSWNAKLQKIITASIKKHSGTKLYQFQPMVLEISSFSSLCYF